MKKTCSGTPLWSSARTSARVTPLAHRGYAAKSAMTDMMSAGAASITIDDVVCSAMASLRWWSTRAASVPDPLGPVIRSNLASLTEPHVRRSSVPEPRGGPVREFSTPPTIDVPATGNLTDDVVTNAREDAG